MKRKLKIKKHTKNDLEKLYHDLCTPLTVMRITLDILSMSKEYKNSSLKIRKSVRLVSKQVDTLIDKISSK